MVYKVQRCAQTIAFPFNNSQIFSTTARFTPLVKQSLFSLQRPSFLLKKTLATVGLYRPVLLSQQPLHHQQSLIRAMSTTTNQSNILKWANEKDGEFKRQVSSFRDIISDAPGSKFTPEAGRYHLYVSLACPWAHRTLVVRALKGLEDLISVDVVHWHLQGDGWPFKEGFKDSLYGANFVKEIYFKAQSDYNGRFTVPVLWDKKTETIVNNESSEIIRMLNTAFDKLVPEKAGINFYPAHLQAEIDSVNEWVYDTINNGVYKSGFATTQSAYDNHVFPLFKSLDRVEEILSKSDYLVGNTLTEADIRLWTTIIRFDPVYVGHFKCNIKSIEKDYPNILKHARRIYQLPKVAGTVDMTHIKHHYYQSHLQINPTGVVPAGTGPNLAEPKIV